MLQDTTVVCPRCELAFPLTETLAQPLLAAERTKIQRENQELTSALKKDEQDLSARQQALDELTRQLDARQNQIDVAVEEKLRAERVVFSKAGAQLSMHPWFRRNAAMNLYLHCSLIMRTG